jgi:hypothetical protein
VDGRFLRAWTDPAAKVQILGRPVYPFCLKYRVRLLAIDSPLLSGKSVPTPLDLLAAVKICAEEPLGELDKNELAMLERLGKMPGKFMDECERFTAYCLVDCWPKFWDDPDHKRGSADDIGIPWPLGVIASLIKNGIEEKRAWEMPECQAIWLNAAWSSAAGSQSKILTTDEEAFMEEQERLEKVAASAEVKTPEPDVPKT